MFIGFSMIIYGTPN